MSDRWAPLTLRDLLNALAGVPNWKILGIHLKVDYPTLNKIEQDYSKSEDRMSEMLYTWMSNTRDATWELLVTALRKMNLNMIANSVEAEYYYSTEEQKSQKELSDISLQTSPTSVVSTMESIPPPLVSISPTPTPTEGTLFLVADSDSPPTQVAISPPPIAGCQISLPPLVPTTECMRTSMDIADSDEDRVQVVEGEIHQLESKFQSLVLNAEEFFTDRVAQHPRFLSKIRISLVHLPASQKPQHLQFFENHKRDILSASSVEEIFFVLGCYWNWWNHSLLQHVIDSFGSRELKSELHCYLTDLEEFQKRTIVEDFMDACSSYLGVPPEFKTVETRMQEDWARYTVYDIRKLGQKLARKVARPSSLETTFVGVSHSSIILIWAVPSTAIHVLAAAIDEKFLQSNKIESVTVNDQDVSFYQTQDGQIQSETPSRPVDPQDLHKACREGNVELTVDLLDAGVDVETRGTQSWRERTPLMTACMYGSLDIVHLLLCFDADVKAYDKDGWTPLMYACSHGKMDVVHVLVEANADVNTCGDTGLTPLMRACFTGHVDVVRVLLEAHANLNAHDKNNWTPLMYACANGSVDIVHALVEAHADLNTQNNEGWTPLMYACAYGSVDIVHVLVEAHADLNARDDDGWTPLMRACANGQVDVVHALVEANADLSAHNKYWTSLSLASMWGHTDIVRILLIAGIQVDAQSEFHGKTALMFSSDVSVVTELLDGGAGVNIQDKRGRTALFHACWKGQIAVMMVLLQRQADVNIPLESGLTPLIVATERGQTEVIELLLSSGKVDTEIQEQETGWTALLIAANDGNVDLVRLLLQCGANPSAVDQQQLTALDIAQGGGHTAVCEELHKYLNLQTKTDRESSCEDPESQQEPRRPDRDSNRSETTNQSWLQEARRRLRALFKRLEDQLLPSKTEKSRIIAGPLTQPPGAQCEEVGVRQPQEVTMTKSVD